ncbi:MAG: 4Fe-4S dicluster domain-containing protein [Hyphomicrobiaceae bacterium]
MRYGRERIDQQLGGYEMDFGVTEDQSNQWIRELAPSAARRTSTLPPQTIRRPQRWDEPFAPEPLPSDLISFVLSQPVFHNVDPTAFPDDLPLAGVIANDTRPLNLRRGEPLYAQGEFDASVYLLLAGSIVGTDATLFGIGEALVRCPRWNTLIAGSDDTIVLEIRWPGVRELRQWSPAFRALTDHLNNEQVLYYGIRNCSQFSEVSDTTCRKLAAISRVEHLGSFDWTHGYHRTIRETGMGGVITSEPVIAEQGDYRDEIVILASGFARVSVAHGPGHRTLGFLESGDIAGLAELIAALADPVNAAMLAESFTYSIHASGRASVVRLPTYALEEIILPSLDRPQQSRFFAAASVNRYMGADGLPLIPPGSQFDVDFAVDHRLMNGTQAMAINLERCVNCDECVRACADSHGGVPRFVRTGNTLANVMVTHACMHCHDPVCMIGCPTQAIDRQPDTGVVTIDETRCIGCTICASTCPYGNIRMEQAQAPNGQPLVGEDGGPVLTAIKCDLCHGQKDGPACQRACPYDALKRVDIGDGTGLTMAGRR